MNVPSPRETKIVMCVQFNFTFWQIPPEMPARQFANAGRKCASSTQSYDAASRVNFPTQMFSFGFNLLPEQIEPLEN